MSQNFNQKDLLENNNQQRDAQDSAPGMVGFWFLCVLTLGILFIYYVKRRNYLITTKEQILENLGNIDAKLTERFNVLTNQLKVAKEALKHEKTLQEEITKARAAVTGPQSNSPQGIADKNQVVSNLSSKWNMVMENYPDIKAMPVLQDLNKTVLMIEDDLQAQRRFYSAIARQYNAALYTWPSNIAASNMHLKRFPVFEAEDQKRANVSLDF